MNRLLYIVRCSALAFILLLLFALAPAMAQNVVYQGQTTSLSVVQVPGHTYDWELYNDGTVNFATVEGKCPVSMANFPGGRTGATVEVKWIEPGSYYFKVTARDALGCAMNLKVGIVKVIPQMVEAVISGLKSAGACERVELDGLKSTPGRLDYEWSSLDQGGELTLQKGVRTEFLLSPAYQGPLPADFRVKLTVTDMYQNTNSTVIIITVSPKPVAAIVSSGKLEKDGSMYVDGTGSTGKELTFLWTTTEGKIFGPENQPTVNLNGAGNYLLQITDIYGCPDKRAFSFPLNINQVDAKDDYVQIPWGKDTAINVLNNDRPIENLIPRSVTVIEKPLMGTANVDLSNGFIMYKPIGNRPGRDKFVYQVCDASNTCDLATVTIDIYDNGVKTTEGFSPNGDGVNDKFVFDGLLPGYPNSQLYVYTRAGQLVFKSDNYKNEWDGTSITSSLTNQELVPTGVYYYILKFGGTNRSMKGFVYVGY